MSSVASTGVPRAADIPRGRYSPSLRKTCARNGCSAVCERGPVWLVSLLIAAGCLVCIAPYVQVVLGALIFGRDTPFRISDAFVSCSSGYSRLVSCSGGYSRFVSCSGGYSRLVSCSGGYSRRFFVLSPAVFREHTTFPFDPLCDYADRAWNKLANQGNCRE